MTDLVDVKEPFKWDKNTMGGNAIGIYDLDENREVIYANKEIDVKNSLKVRYAFMKQTNLLSSVTADIFRCKSDT